MTNYHTGPHRTASDLNWVPGLRKCPPRAQLWHTVTVTFTVARRCEWRTCLRRHSGATVVPTCREDTADVSIWQNTSGKTCIYFWTAVEENSKLYTFLTENYVNFLLYYRELQQACGIFRPTVHSCICYQTCEHFENDWTTLDANWWRRSLTKPGRRIILDPWDLRSRSFLAALLLAASGAYIV